MAENEQVEKCYALAAQAGVDIKLLETAKERSAGDPKRFLYEILSQDGRQSRLRQFLDEGAKNWTDCTDYLCGTDNSSERDRADLLSLVNLCVRARKDDRATPLLPARYHLFIRAPEGAFLCLHPESQVLLDRREKSDEGFPVFELATCRRCGQEYLVGHIDEDHKLKHSFSESDARSAKYFLLWRDSESIANDEDQEVANPEEVVKKGRTYRLCGRCGHVADGLIGCGCTEPSAMRTIVVIDVPEDKGLSKCYLCGYTGTSVVRGFTFQQDAPAAVIVTAIYQRLENKAGSKKKILAFSDSRQDAAFFAPYLKYTYDRLLFRRLIVDALQKNLPLGDYRMRSLNNDVLRLAEDKDIFEQSLDLRERRQEVWRWILQDFTGMWDRKNSPEGVGIA
jgi:hypothetical protein